ncbi:MAG TPA: hypothetical protein PKD24_16960 [Pyrinomonadaceae bacterium]|nr:hypothetical protein [Pyrinomonadaceae bacterium]HMP67099.1 hypothetical protein [Pyrinomonadaceae bacterium]
MQTDLSNQVLARIDGETRDTTRRTLDLGNISTPELGLLLPQRSEIAPRGLGRDAALIAYSERLRENYRANEGGMRDGMLKLGEAVRNGQTIAVSCFCRAGQICHADIVKNAIEKVGRSLVREAAQQKALGGIEHSSSDLRPNPRTARAINELLSVSRSDLILAKLGDTEGRNRSEQASHLNAHSQFLRDLYERGAVVRDGVLISPKENPSPAPPLAITTVEYALKRLEPIINESRAREIAPQLVEYGQSIAGTSADRDTKIKVFNWLYGALEGRHDLLTADERVFRNETKDERFDRALNEIATLAEEMRKLEPSDRLVLLDDVNERTDANDIDRNEGELSLETVYEHALDRDEIRQQIDPKGSISGLQEFERVELDNTTLSRLAAEMSKEELDHWINVRLPVLDEMLESGTYVDAILKPFQNDIYQAAKEDPANKQAAIDDLRFATAYIEHQLKQPESKLRHFNPRYRNYAAMLENAASRSEVMDAASKIRLENARLGLQWETLTEAEKTNTPRPLTSKEMQFLFTEVSPRHYTAEMTALRLAYSNSGIAARTKTAALMRGEIEPSKEAMQLIESLGSRLERRHSTDSLSATKHFLQSLKTPNEELRYKNGFDHSEVYKKLPPAERDFVYQRAVFQKEQLEAKSIGNGPNEPGPKQDQAQIENVSAKIGTALRGALKGDLVELLTRNPEIKGRELADRTSRIIESNLEKLGPKTVSDAAVTSWSREVGAGMSQLLQAGIEHRRGVNERDRGRGTVETRTPANQAYER